MVIPPARESTTEERLLAAVSHGSALLFIWGVFLPLGIWIIQRQRSAFVTFHALQALTFQLFHFIYMTLLALGVVMLVVLVQFSVIAISASGQNGSAELSPFFFVLTQLVLIASFSCGLGLYGLLGVLGAILIIAKRDFYYPIFGRRLQRYLEVSSSSVETGIL